MRTILAAVAEASVNDYRLYFLDDRNHIVGVRELACEDDECAIALAAKWLDGRRMELWRHDHLINRYPEDGTIAGRQMGDSDRP